MQILAALKRLCVEQQGTTVITVLHDVNLVSLFADKALLLSAGSFMAFGPVHEVLNEEKYQRLTEVICKTMVDTETGAHYFVPRIPFTATRVRI